MGEKILIIYYIKIFFISIYTYYISAKILNIKHIKNPIIIITSIILAAICTFIRAFTDSMISILVFFFLYNFCTEIFIEKRIKYSMLTTLISFTFTLISLGISTTMSYFPYKLLNLSSYMINLCIIIIIQGLIIYNFFKIKRFKNGFIFLQKSGENRYIDIIIINVCIIIIFAYCLLGNDQYKLIRNLYLIFIILGIIMIITIQKTLVLYYKQKLLEKTIGDYKEEINEKDEIIKKTKEENFKFSKINHEFYNRQKALEAKVREIINSTQSLNVEMSEELGIVERIQNLSNEYASKVEETKGLNKLPTTDVSEIDDMFKYMQKECVKNNINFNLQLNGNIHYMVNNLIPKNKLETLIGDHIRDAIIAINSSTNTYKSILTILGIRDECYELCIYDTGIEFEIETLLTLGLERITTHKETGGSGIGFMTTFETLKECKASLIIEEKHPIAKDDYTKAVIIRFDGKSEYRINSYRAKEIGTLRRKIE